LLNVVASFEGHKWLTTSVIAEVVSKMDKLT